MKAFADYKEDKYLITIPKKSITRICRMKYKDSSESNEEVNGRVEYTFKFNSYKKYLKIENEINRKLKKKHQIQINRSDRLEEYISSRKLYLEERTKLGIAIKHNNKEIIKEENYKEFEKILEKTMIRKLRNRQKLAAYHTIRMKRSMNFSVPGSGKTSMVYGSFAYLYTKEICNKLIIIAPKNAQKAWEDEFDKCFGNKIEKKFCNLKNKTVYTFLNSNIYFINYESVGAEEENLKDLIDSNSLIVLDEIHRIKNPTGKRSQSVCDVTNNAGYIVSLTGTPLPNKHGDLYQMLQILFKDDADFFDYSYDELKKITVNQEEQLKQDINPFYFRITKEDLDVPPKNMDLIYKIEEPEIEQEIFKIIYAKDISFFAKFVFLTQIQSNPRGFIDNLEKGNYQFSEKEEERNLKEEFSILNNELNAQEKSLIKSVDKTIKVTMTINLIKKLVAQGKSVVVWCIYRDSMNKIENELKKININCKQINGSIENDERSKIIDEFNSEKIKVLITNPQTLAESVSLHNVCHDAIYMELNLNMAHFAQSKDRIHRLGLDKKQYTQYHFMINSAGGFNALTLEKLEEKEKIMNEVLNSDYLFKNSDFSDTNYKELIEKIIFIDEIKK